MSQNPPSQRPPEFPLDADERRSVPPVICYDVDRLPAGPSASWLIRWRESLQLIDSIVVPPREAATFHVAGGQAFRILCIDGPQVGDLNLWNAHDLGERFYSGKTRQLHATHLTTGDRLWSNLPYLRQLATITHDSLAWYGFDADGAGVHDVIGTRCDPCTNHLLRGDHYHHCCHSNLVRALMAESGLAYDEAERHVHDVLNVFMCTGFLRDTGQYFMKASPVRPGNMLEFRADTDVFGALSACPGGDCGNTHSNDETRCFPLQIDILAPSSSALAGWSEAIPSGYQVD